MPYLYRLTDCDLIIWLRKWLSVGLLICAAGFVHAGRLVKPDYDR